MNEATRNRHIGLAEARKSIYNLLSALYLELPDQKMARSILDPDFKQTLSDMVSAFETGAMREGLKLISNFISTFRNLPEEEVLRRIAVDRTRLFRGISEKYSPPPPYESVYREERLCGENTAGVARIYCGLGVTLPEGWNEPPDYLGIELDFMRLVCQSEEEAWCNNNTDKALELLEAGKDFLKGHLVQWVPKFCEKMYEKAELDFYKGLAKLTTGFLEYDSHLVEEQVKEIKAERKE